MLMFKFKSNGKIIICSNIPYLSTDYNNVIGTMIRGDKVWDIIITECDSENEAEALLTEIFNEIKTKGARWDSVVTIDIDILLENIRVVNNDNLLEKMGE